MHLHQDESEPSAERHARIVAQLREEKGVVYSSDVADAMLTSIQKIALRGVKREQVQATEAFPSGDVRITWKTRGGAWGSATIRPDGEIVNSYGEQLMSAPSEGDKRAA